MVCTRLTSYPWQKYQFISIITTCWYQNSIKPTKYKIPIHHSCLLFSRGRRRHAAMKPSNYLLLPGYQPTTQAVCGLCTHFCQQTTTINTKNADKTAWIFPSTLALQCHSDMRQSQQHYIIYHKTTKSQSSQLTVMDRYYLYNLLFNLLFIYLLQFTIVNL